MPRFQRVLQCSTLSASRTSTFMPKFSVFSPSPQQGDGWEMHKPDLPIKRTPL